MVNVRILRSGPDTTGRSGLTGPADLPLPPPGTAPGVGSAFRHPAATFRGAAAENNSGLMQPIPSEAFNVVAAQRAWVDRRCRPQALATFLADRRWKPVNPFKARPWTDDYTNLAGSFYSNLKNRWTWLP